MKRVKKRRYGRDKSVVASAGSTHVIKLGWKTLSKNGKEIPNKLAGFLVCRDTVDGQNGNRLLIDYAAMERLGCGKAQVETAIAKGFTAPEGLLPTQLRFVVMNNAQAAECGGFDYPGIHAEAYERYTKKGLECFGDGLNADRKMDDGTRRHLPCVPYGREDARPEEYCKFSGPGGECKLHYRLTVCLYYVDKAGVSRPLSPELGEQARYRLDSTSEYVSMQVLDELDRAAGRVRGLINGLTGTLTFQKKSRRTGEGSAIVGSVLFSIDEDSIRRREREIAESDERQRQHLIENKREGIEFTPGAIVMIEGPAADPPRQDAAPASATIEEEPDAPEPVADVEIEEEPDAPDMPVQSPDIELMIKAIGEWTELVSLENDEARHEPLRRLMVKIDARAAGVAATVEDENWFRGHGISSQRRAGREDLLVAMCEYLTNSNDKNFRLTADEEAFEL